MDEKVAKEVIAVMQASNLEILQGSNLIFPIPLLPTTKKPPMKQKEPLFLNLGGNTVRINPRQTPTSYIGIQIIIPDDYDNEGKLIRKASITQLWLSAADAKKFADILTAESALELVE